MPDVKRERVSVFILFWECRDSRGKLTIVHPNGPHAKLNAAISIITNEIRTLPITELGSFPGIPKHPTTKIDTVMIPVVTMRRGRRGSLFASSTAARTTTTCRQNTISVIENGSSRPMSLANTVPK